MANRSRPFKHRVASAFELLRNGLNLYTLGQIVIAYGAGKGVKVMLSLFSRINPLLLNPIWILTTGTLLIVFGRKRNKSRNNRNRIWDAVGDFSIDDNQSGPWSYGWSRNGLANDFAVHTHSRLDALPGVDRWESPLVDKDISVMHNRTGRTVRGVSFPILPDMLHMHPGQAGIYDVVRWTCPVSGIFAIVGQFCGLDDNTQGNSDVNVALNSNRSLFGSTAPVLHGIGSQQPIAIPEIPLTTGDKIDFIVGLGPTYGADSTGFKAKIILQ